MTVEYKNLKLDSNERKNLWLLLPYLEDIGFFKEDDVVVPTALLYRYSGENWKLNHFNPLKLKCKIFDATTGKVKKDKVMSEKTYKMVEVDDHHCHSFIKEKCEFEYKGQQMTNFDEKTARMILKNGDAMECMQALDGGGIFQKFRGIPGIADPWSPAGFKKVVLNG